MGSSALETVYRPATPIGTCVWIAFDARGDLTSTLVVFYSNFFLTIGKRGLSFLGPPSSRLSYVLDENVWIAIAIGT